MHEQGAKMDDRGDSIGGLDVRYLHVEHVYLDL